MAFSPPAKAQETDPRFYIGGGGGLFIDNGDCPANSVCDYSTTGFKVFAGSRLSDNFAIEAAYSITGEHSLEDATQKIETDYQTFSIAPVFHVPIGDGNSILAKVGVHNWEADFEVTTSRGIAIGSLDGTDIFYGVGTQWQLTENLGLKVEWERYNFDVTVGTVSASGDIDSFGVNLVYIF